MAAEIFLTTALCLARNELKPKSLHAAGELQQKLAAGGATDVLDASQPPVYFVEAQVCAGVAAPGLRYARGRDAPPAECGRS